MILCCGESLIDMIPDEGRFRPMPGGSVYNTAVALGRLGAEAAYLWPLSTDRFGAALRDPLAEAGVDISLCPQTDRPTTLAFVFLENGEATYSFYDEATAGRMFEPAALPPLPDDLEALFLGGISLIQDPSGAAVEELAHRAAESRALVMLDLNIRPALIGDDRATRDRLGRLMRIADIVKMSDEDAAWLFPAAGAEITADRLQDLGPRMVLRTCGPDGAVAIWAGGEVSHPGQTVEVVDTIGAGDSFNAGFLTGLARANALDKSQLEGLSPETVSAALDLAVQAAAITVSREGANPPWRAELGG